MEGLFVGLMIFATVLAIIGLVLVFLQKKGKVSSFTTMTASGSNYVSVGKQSLFRCCWVYFCFTGIPFYGQFCTEQSFLWLTY